ncbi:hypothetical protein TEA_019159 [Camellia sinensis var. sinensis]|uniref:RNA helicase n=1 Tax=Camellia sinensis var. sinensis TaxID=542762 RepID=A0A4S4EJW3_CAMSN|nr:hypothetical protein TEA_019159 [Camellia sinensis var. sinensis]
MAPGGAKNSNQSNNQLNSKVSNDDRRAEFFARSHSFCSMQVFVSHIIDDSLVEKRLVEEVRSNNILIIVGETGSGKTTQLPQFLFNAGLCHDGKVVGITQPRRVAAVSVAKRVAEECGVQLGQRVGYSIRFDDTTSSSTRIKYMTDGLLLREALLDPYLSRYSVIIVDEAHERTVHTDVLLGLLKSVQKVRSVPINECPNIDRMKANNGLLMEKENDAQRASILKQCRGIKLSPLKLIIMSASLDARVFSEYFGGARAVHVQGRQFPVDILYTRHPETDYLDATLITLFQIHLEEGPGDILVFLTGQEEIESVERLVQEKLRQLPEDNQKVKVLSIFSSLPSEKQMQVFMPAPTGFRKVILATNIAETSVTIPGIKYVIDPGFVKARTYCVHTGMESLNIVPTSKAQALQRSGRAGREGPGKCFRLYPESEFEKLSDSTDPEISRCNLSNVILQLKALGVDDIIGFDFMEKPSRPNDGFFGLITSSYLLMYFVSYLTARTAAKCFSSLEGDHPTLIAVYRAFDEFSEKSNLGNSREKTEKNLRKWCKENFINSRALRHARDIHRQATFSPLQIQGNIEQMGLGIASCGDDMLQFRRCLAAAFFLNAALKQPDGTYRVLSSGQVVQIHPSSVFFRTKPDCIIFDEFVRTTHNYVRNVTRIDYLWLAELAPQYYTLQEQEQE